MPRHKTWHSYTQEYIVHVHVYARASPVNGIAGIRVARQVTTLYQVQYVH